MVKKSLSAVFAGSWSCMQLLLQPPLTVLLGRRALNQSGQRKREQAVDERWRGVGKQKGGKRMRFSHTVRS